MYGPYLTIAEINAKYPNAMILIANPTTRRGSLAPTGGHVALHAPTRPEFNRLFEAWSDPTVREWAIHWTGKPEDPDTLWVEPVTEAGAAGR